MHAAELFRRGVTLEDIEQAIALACCGKYAGLMNGTDNEMIRRFSYFRDTLEEVRDPETHPMQAQQLKRRILTAEYYEENGSPHWTAVPVHILHRQRA